MKKTTSTILSVLLIFSVLFSLSPISVFAADSNSVTFKDINLEKAVRSAINKPTGTLTHEDVAAIETLDYSPKLYLKDRMMDQSKIESYVIPNPSIQITSLDGIENLVNLKSLTLKNNRLTDIKPLRFLYKLTYLDLGNGTHKNDNWYGENEWYEWNGDWDIMYTTFSKILNQISDISPLSSLTNLESLDLNWNRKIMDITPLTGLIKLNELRLGENSISDISALSKMKNLYTLLIHCNKIRDITPIKDLLNLENLSIMTNQIRDISPLTGLNYVKRLSINGNPIRDLSVLEKLESIEELSMDWMTIKDISFLKKMSGLTSLCINHFKTDDFTIVGSLSQLQWLCCTDCNLTDIRFIKNLTNLRGLNLSDNKITNISPLAELYSLEFLELNNNKISSLEPLRQLSCIKKLFLRDNPISSFEPIYSYYNNLQEKDFTLDSIPETPEPSEENPEPSTDDFFIVSVTPDDGAKDVPVDTTIEIKFSQNVHKETVNEESIYLLDENNEVVPVRFAAQGFEKSIVRFTPLMPLNETSIYTVYVTSNIADENETPFPSDICWEFTTGENTSIFDPPTSPKGLKGIAVDSFSIKWTWQDMSDDEEGFILKDDKGNIIAKIDRANSTFYVEKNLLPGTIYKRTVCAYGMDYTNEIVESNNSVPATAKTSGKAFVLPKITVKSNEISNKKITYRWDIKGEPGQLLKVYDENMKLIKDGIKLSDKVYTEYLDLSKNSKTLIRNFQVYTAKSGASQIIKVTVDNPYFSNKVVLNAPEIKLNSFVNGTAVLYITDKGIAEKGFNVYMTEDNGKIIEKLQSAATVDSEGINSTVTVTIYGLDPDSIIFVGVKAYNDEGESDTMSNIVKIGD